MDYQDEINAALHLLLGVVLSAVAEQDPLSRKRSWGQEDAQD
jgi:hypothetical protein